jgi:hypothetical protein
MREGERKGLIYRERGKGDNIYIHRERVRERE